MMKLLIKANMKISANTVFVFNAKQNTVKSQKPHTIRYSATAALYPTDAAPSAALPVVEYDAAIPHEGVCSTPNESQNTANIPIAIMEKKLPIIHSKMQASRRSTGPVK